MTPVVVNLPFPPSTNNATAVVRGRKIKSKAYRLWQDEAFGCAQRQLGEHPVPIVGGKYKLDIAVERPDRRRRDVANLEKACSDLLQLAGIIRDDCDAQSVTIRWASDEPVKDARVTVCVFPEEPGIKIGGRE